MSDRSTRPTRHRRGKGTLTSGPPVNPNVAPAERVSVDPITEASRIVDSGKERGLTLRVTGGVAIASLCASARRPPLRRLYEDIDFVARSRDSHALTELFRAIGYQPEEEFNALHGHKRLFFVDLEHSRRADVFLDRLEMCHLLEFGNRLERTELTLPPSDLLLSKLQVVETNSKDYLDMVSLLTDLPLTDGDDAGIDRDRILGICTADWGWWRTVTNVGSRVSDFAKSLSREHAVGDAACERMEQLLEQLEEAPKSFKWKVRARVGERVPWHESPEEIDHIDGEA